MVPLRRNVYLILICGTICAVLLFMFGIHDGLQSYRLEEPTLMKDGALHLKDLEDTVQKVVELEDSNKISSDVVWEDSASRNQELPAVLEHHAPPPAPELVCMVKEAFPPADKSNQDSPLNIRKEEVLQLPLPPDTEPKISAGEMLDQTLLEIDELVDASDTLNSSFINISIMGVWHDWKPILNRSDVFPESLSAMQEGFHFWRELMRSVLDDMSQEQQRLAQSSAPSPEASAPATSDPWEQCPYAVSELNATKLLRDVFVLQVPCGLVVDSSITFVGVPRGFMGDFKINLLGERLPGEQTPAIILHFNVRWHGDLVSNTSVIVQNSWTLAHDWQEEQRCPPLKEPENVTTGVKAELRNLNSQFVPLFWLLVVDYCMLTLTLVTLFCSGWSQQMH